MICFLINSIDLLRRQTPFLDRTRRMWGVVIAATRLTVQWPNVSVVFLLAAR